jgi:SAM-dependent methyltransferase
MAAGFNDPRIAASYDAFSSSDAGMRFYLALAGTSPLRILDIGCGTGVLACAFAERGHEVTGIDAADAMLAIARARPGCERVTWLNADARTFQLDTRFDLVAMTGHVFQEFLEDGEVRAVLSRARTHLAPGGRLAFETRSPAARAWTRWTPEASLRTVQVEGIGTVEVHYNVLGVRDGYVDFESYHRFGDTEPVVNRGELRFMAQPDVARRLTDAGFSDAEWYGDWDGAPWEEHSPEIIVVASVP